MMWMERGITMTSKYELSMSIEYTPDWGVMDGLREFAQNCYDGEIEDSENTASIEYDSENKKLYFNNKKSNLSRESLLLGNSPKANDKSTVGRHGEGYKLGILVLNRSGKKVTIYNYEANEVWATKIVDSKRFNSKIVRIDIDKKVLPMSKNGLIVEVEGITSEEWEEFKGNTLRLQGEYARVSTNYGDLLLNKEHSGKIFVGGLYVTDNNKFKYGYNFPPSSIRLDRDRRIIDSFDLSWESSNVWLSIKDEKYFSLLYELINQTDYIDACYITSKSTFDMSAFSKYATERFIEENGEDVFPIYNESDRLKVAGANIKSVIVTRELRNTIQSRVLKSMNLKERDVKFPRELYPLKTWFESYEMKLGEEEKNTFWEAMNEVIKNMTGRTGN